MTQFKELRGSALTLKSLVNHRLDKMRYGDTLHECVVDGLFMLGIGITDLEPGGRVAFDMDVGVPYCASISLDDFLMDMPAKRVGAMTYMGHRYDVKASEIVSDESYRLTREFAGMLGGEADEVKNEDGSDRATTISRETSREHYRRHLELVDVHLIEEGEILTFLAAQHGDDATVVGDPIRIRSWKGPPEGRYDLLQFRVPPDQIMPLSPVAVLYDLHCSANTAYRKLFQSSDGAKDVFTYMSESADDAQRIKDAPHLSFLRVTNPQGVAVQRTGGIDNSQLSWAIHLTNVFKEQAGNLDLVGGLSPSSGTLGQDRLLGANASKRLQEMQDRATDFAARQMRKVAWYYFHDPNLNERIVKEIEGTKRTVASTATHDDMRGDYLDYNYELDPYSLPNQSPSQRLQTLLGVFQGVIAPSLPFMAQQGHGIDWEAFLGIIAEYAPLPELKQIMTFIGDAPSEGPSGSPPRATTTRRINERVNRTESKPDDAILQKFLSGAGQNGRS
jgi:hypothetical protein